MEEASQEPLARHRIAEIREELSERFSGDLVIGGAISKTLGDIIDAWDAREPISSADADALASAIRKPVDALLHGQIGDAKAAAEQLARSWHDVRRMLKW